MANIHSYLVDWVKDELVETTDVSVLHGLCPLLGLGVEAVISPQSLHELSYIDVEL